MLFVLAASRSADNVSPNGTPAAKRGGKQTLAIADEEGKVNLIDAADPSDWLTGQRARSKHSSLARH